MQWQTNTSQKVAQRNTLLKNCADTLRAEYISYGDREKQALVDVKRGSKVWCSKSRRLLQTKQKTSSIPALKVNGVWELDAKKKAAAFAESFLAKAVLPELVTNKYTPTYEDGAGRCVRNKTNNSEDGAGRCVRNKTNNSEDGARRCVRNKNNNNTIVYPSASDIETLLCNLSIGFSHCLNARLPFWLPTTEGSI